jgi:autotransporter-associated beta strand protein
VLGELTLAGATLTQASTDAGGYQGFQLRGNVTVSGTSPSTISTTASKANHLGTNTVFTVADVTSSAATDLVVSAPFANQSTDFTNATGGLTKAGPGKMTLTGASTYTGATLVTAGVLQVDGSLGNTAVTVSGTGALGGSGSIAGAVSILSTLAPGASPGQMTLSNTLNLAAGSTFEAEVGKEVAGGLTIPGVGYDQIAMTGTGTTVTIADGALLKVVDLPNVEIGDVYTIVDNTAGGILTGLLRDANNANVLLTEGSTVFGSLGNQYTISYANNDVTLTAQIPEPGSAVAAAMAGLGLLARRRRRKA